MDALLFDLDGVLYQGDRVIDGAVETLQWCVEFFDAAVRKLGTSGVQTVMIGDDICGDVGGAQAAGLAGVLVRTGKFRAGDLEGDIRPDAVLDSIADLPQWWENRGS
jgi:ribonucleotide monophosphatase NagD (HAD superfamily)